MTTEEQDRRATYVFHVAVDEARRLVSDAKTEIMGFQGCGAEFFPRLQARVSVLNFILATLDYAKKEEP